MAPSTIRLKNAMRKLDDTMRKLERQHHDESAARGRDLDERIDKLVSDIHNLISQIPPEGVFGE